MPTIMPQSELLRRAVTFVSETRQERPEQSMASIIDEASMRFNLSPLDGEALLRLFAQEAVKESPRSPG